MNFLKVCLKLPNLGLLAFHIIFIIIMPYLFLAYNQNEVLKFYWPVLITLATIFTETGKPFIFNNLYSTNPKNFIEFVSSNIINLVAVMGLIWQSINYYNDTKDLEKAIVIAVVLFLITFPLAREGTVFVIRKWDKFIRNKTDMNVKYNYHKFIIGFIYMIFLISLQVILLNLTSNVKLPNLINNENGNASNENGNANNDNPSNYTARDNIYRTAETVKVSVRGGNNRRKMRK